MPYRLVKFTLVGFILLIGLCVFNRVPAQAVPQEIYLTAQQYDNGLMIWRGDNGDVWVLLNTQQAYKFVTAYYTRLSEKPIVVPPGRIKPMASFGKIWNNLPYIRAALGYPTLPEIGFKSNVSYSSTNKTVSFPQLNGKVLVTYQTPSGYYWQYGVPGTEPKKYTTWAAFQSFDNGYMIWRADTQEVLVFLGKISGQMSGYLVDLYRTWPDNQVTDTPPAGHFKPINALGRVWSYTWLNNKSFLGWAIMREQGYTATVIEYPTLGQGPQGVFSYSISLPNGRKINISKGFSYANWDIQ